MLEKELTSELGDYERVGARYTRSFLWTGPLYYAAVQYGFVVLGKRKLEKIAGSFDIVESEANTHTTMVRVGV
jgi:phosphatidylglycerol phospholipase C